MMKDKNNMNAANINYENRMRMAELPLPTDNDPEFWKQWLKDQEYSPEWLSLLPSILGKLSPLALSCYADTIPLNRPNVNQSLHQITSAFQAMPDEEFESVMQIIAPRICVRWEEHLNQLKQQRLLQTSIYVTAYSDVVYFSFAHILRSYNAWQNEFLRWKIILEHDMEQWFESQAHASSYFFIDLTQIHMLLQIYKKSSAIMDDQLHKVFHEIYWIMEKYDFLWLDPSDVYKNDLESQLLSCSCDSSTT